MITKVVITILDDEDNALEKGETVRREGDSWEYAPNLAEKTVTAEAYDLAGNVTKSALPPSCAP